jgi:hypothetical protein
MHCIVRHSCWCVQRLPILKQARMTPSHRFSITVVCASDQWARTRRTTRVMSYTDGYHRAAIVVNLKELYAPSGSAD